jgi:hypothetical protein
MLALFSYQGSTQRRVDSLLRRYYVGTVFIPRLHTASRWLIITPLLRWYCFHTKAPHSVALTRYYAVVQTLLIIWKYRLIILKKTVMTKPMSWPPEIWRLSAHLYHSVVQKRDKLLLQFIVAGIYSQEYASIWSRVHIVCIAVHVIGWGEERWRNVTYLFRKFLRMLKMDPLNVV